jgi:hypothetical protein
MKTNCSPSTSRTTIHHVFAYLLIVALIAFAFPRSGNSQTIKDIATNATDPSNLADTEPSIAVDPSNPLRIAVVSFSEPWGAGVMAPVWKSTDGGVTWTKVTQIPRPSSNVAGPGDQKVAFDSTGKIVIAELDFIPKDYIYRQTGMPNAALTQGAQYGDDQPHLEVDKTGASPCFNRTYSPYLNFSGTARSHVVKSPDFGATVTDVTAGSGAFPNRTTRIAVAPNGKAYIVYKTREGAVGADFENAHFRVMRSDDCGATWGGLGATGTPVHAGTVVTWFTNNFGNPAKGKVARARSSDAWIATDPSSGDIYAAFCNKDASGFGQIFVARSTDQGLTWSSTRVTDGTHHSAYPEVAVAANGAIGVLYIDFDDSGAATIFRHRLARSFNHGSTWTHSNLQSMDPGPIANASSGFLWGDYEGITAQGNKFYGVFTGQSIGRSTLQLDPIFFSAPATQLVFPNICVIHPEICHGLCEIPCPRCFGNCLFEIIIEDLIDPWEAVLFDPRGNPVKVQQVKRGNTVTMRFRANEQFADKLGEYAIVFKGGKAGSSPNAKIQVKAIQ